jgi:lipopolysaccharide biosynthesis glycosyltransferase
MAAVEDPGCSRIQQLSLPPNSLYFNSGVMVINLSKWRRDSISLQLHKYIQENISKLEYHDQDALNAVLCGKWLPISPKWNQQSVMFKLNCSETSFTSEEYEEALRAPAVIHYTTSSKPWDYMNEHPYRQDYFDHLQHTGWNIKYPMATHYVNNVRKCIKKTLINVFAQGNGSSKV